MDKSTISMAIVHGHGNLGIYSIFMDVHGCLGIDVRRHSLPPPIFRNAAVERKLIVLVAAVRAMSNISLYIIYLGIYLYIYIYDYICTYTVHMCVMYRTQSLCTL